jgi:hypothetical protein
VVPHPETIATAIRIGNRPAGMRRSRLGMHPAGADRGRHRCPDPRCLPAAGLARGCVRSNRRRPPRWPDCWWAPPGPARA